MMASISVTPSARAASTTWLKISSAGIPLAGAPLSGIRAPNLDLAETRGAGAVARTHHLLRLSFAAIGHAPQCPVVAVGDGVTGVPELRRDAAIAWVLEHADALTMTNLPAHLAA